MKLCELRDNPGAHKRSRPIGRGIGSGRGKTAGRGGKGQTARSGVRLKGFQGGQTPLSRRLPKLGFTNIHRLNYNEVNLGQLQTAIDMNKLSDTEVITNEVLRRIGFFKKTRDGLRILGDGELTRKVQLEVAGISKRALKVITSLGGNVTIIGA